MPKFTRQQYNIIAEVLASVSPTFDPKFLKTRQYMMGSDNKFAEVVRALTQEFKKDNPKFDVDKFHNTVLHIGSEPSR